MSLIASLVEDEWLKTPRIIEAFKKIKRLDFLPAAPFGGEPRPLYGREENKNLAELNEALSIGHGQTISQPLVVAFMLELLQPEPGEKILDIGSGSGWTTALLSEIVSNKGNGKVIGIEIIPGLKDFGEKNVAKYDYVSRGIAKFICADATEGYKSEAPYDKILASASARDEIPKAWKEQLKIKGRIVMPINTSIWLFVKKEENDFEKTEYPGFIFVPLVKK